ncbi:MAG: efflux RND transporter periplasmic adaptor subunit, partial [Pseudomonadota bacterium]|nr:efflux RND transporter periplasmic adaptor subunit [Pseudomonadota bacterium]
MPDHAPPLPPHASGVPARRRWGAWLVGLLLVLALAALAYYLVQRAKAPAGAAPAGMAGGGPPGMGGPPGGPGGPGGAGGGSVTVGSALARQGDLPVLVDALGTVTAPTTVTLVPQVSGTLTEVLFAEGQMVRKGQLLARIDPRSYEQTLAQARAARARDEAQLAVAQQTLQRYQTLWQQDSIARQEVDTQAALVRQLQATVASDRAAEGAAELNVGHTRIVAPLAGRVGLRTVDAGNYVSSGSSTGIATITQMDPMDVVFAVPQERIPDVVAAQAKGALPVTALDGTRTRTLAEGQFATLDNAIDTTTGTVKAKARFANADGQLFPNQFVNVRLQLGTRAGVLVPVTAVRTGPQGDYVYVIDEQGVAHMRTVQRGMATVDEMLIAQGLQAGERVVTEGGDRVKDGGAVQLSGSGGAGPRGAASGARG